MPDPFVYTHWSGVKRGDRVYGVVESSLAEVCGLLTPLGRAGVSPIMDRSLEDVYPRATVLAYALGGGRYLLESREVVASPPPKRDR